ncbi:MAG: transcriptional repressor LexA [Candidatus Eisenbacteria bacterium]
MQETKDLSPRQRETLEWVKKFIQEHEMPPTVREIGDAFGIKSSSVFDLLKALERKGYVRRGDLGARSLIIEKQGSDESEGCVEVPVVGRIPAGQPVEAIEGDLGSVPVRKADLRGGAAFALRVEGRSMVDAGILDGDYVIVRQQRTADDGDIVVALIEDQATLKRFRRQKGRVRLDPANREMKPIFVSSGEFKIQGKIVAVHRMM